MPPPGWRTTGTATARGTVLAAACPESTTGPPTRTREPAEAERQQRVPPPVDVGRLALIRSIHTAVWCSIESCVGYLLWSGATGRSDRRAAAAAAVVAGECLVFAANGFRCPLTGLAEAAGATSGSVTDIYLPAWFARNLPAIHVPLLVLIGWLHWRTARCRSVRRRR